MGKRLKRALVAGLAVLALLGPSAAFAGRDGDGDHDLARDLHEGGEIRALSEILRQIAQEVPGDIVAVDLVRDGGKWVYRVQIVSADGQRHIVDIDAGAGTELHDAGRD